MFSVLKVTDNRGVIFILFYFFPFYSAIYGGVSANILKAALLNILRHILCM